MYQIQLQCKPVKEGTNIYYDVKTGMQIIKETFDLDTGLIVIEVMKRLRGGPCMDLIDYQVESGQLNIASCGVEARTIGNYVKEDISFVDFKRLVIVLLNALVYVHSKSVAIGALTPETIFITPNERVIFMDFSQSRLQDVAYTCIKSMPVDVYRSPESVYEPWMVSELSDVFSMGMILKRLIDTTHLTIQFHYAEIIEKMTRVRMQDRPKLQDVLNWINT